MPRRQAHRSIRVEKAENQANVTIIENNNNNNN